MAEDNSLGDYVSAREEASSAYGRAKSKFDMEQAAMAEDARTATARELKGEHPNGPPITQYNYPQAANDGNLPPADATLEQFDQRYAVAPDTRTLHEKSAEYDLPNQITALGVTPKILENTDPEAIGNMQLTRIIYNSAAKAAQESVDFIGDIMGVLPDRPKRIDLTVPTIGEELPMNTNVPITEGENLATFMGSLVIGSMAVNKGLGLLAGREAKIPLVVSESIVGMAYQDPTKGEATLPPWLLKAAGVKNEDVIEALDSGNYEPLTGRIVNGLEWGAVFGLIIPKASKAAWLISSGIARGLVQLAKGELKGGPAMGGPAAQAGQINARGIIDPFPKGDKAPATLPGVGERNLRGSNLPAWRAVASQSPRSLVNQLYLNPEPKAFPNQRAFAESLDSRAGGVLEETPENMQAFADIIANEALYAIERDPAAAKWYRDRVAGMKRVAALMHEDLVKNPEQEMAFEIAMALSSNGTTVASNAEQGLRIFEEFAQTGKFPESVPYAGKEHEAIAYGLRVYNQLTEKMTFEELRAFLDSKMTVREVNARAKALGLKPIGGELMETMVHGSAIFGPKIGGGFFQNLHGNYDPLTMDRWFMRLWNRVKGDLATKVSPELHAERIDRFRSALTVEDAKSVGVRINNPATAKDATLMRVANALHDRYAGGGYKDKTELNKAAKQLVADFQKTNDAPMTGSRRKYMRETFALALERVNRETGLNLQNADLQALVWYPEKDFYAMNGVSNAKAAPTDYQTEFEKLAIARGLAPKDVLAASNPATTIATERGKIQ